MAAVTTETRELVKHLSETLPDVKAVMDIEHQRVALSLIIYEAFPVAVLE